MYSFDEVLNYDPEVAKAMEDELTRQRTHIELIASENLVSKAVMAAMGLMPLRELKSSLAVSMQTFSHTQVHRLTLQHSLQW